MSEGGYAEDEPGIAAALELLSDADERVDMYGMNELEADLYLSTHYSQVVAHDTLRLYIFSPWIKSGAAKRTPGGYLRLSDEAVQVLQNMTRLRNWNPLRSFRAHREFARVLLREWEQAGVVRLSVLASMPRTLPAENYQGRAAGAVTWDADGKATLSFAPEADAATFTTSMALFFRRMLSREQQRAAELAFDIRGATWTAEDEERFARAYLRWVSEGNAPRAELSEAFETFNKIATAEMLDIELTDEMRALFRSMLTSD